MSSTYGSPDRPVPLDPMSLITEINFLGRADVAIMACSRFAISSPTGMVVKRVGPIGDAGEPFGPSPKIKWVGLVYFPFYLTYTGSFSFPPGEHPQGDYRAEPTNPRGPSALHYIPYPTDRAAFPYELPTATVWDELATWHVGFGGVVSPAPPAAKINSVLINCKKLREMFDVRDEVTGKIKTPLSAIVYEAALTYVDSTGSHPVPCECEFRAYRDVENIGASGFTMDTSGYVNFHSGRELVRKRATFNEPRPSPNIGRQCRVNYNLKKVYLNQAGTDYERDEEGEIKGTGRIEMTFTYNVGAGVS